jgi:hypothetical protein
MATVAVNRFEWIRQRNALRALNRLTKLHTLLMPHQITTATGCEKPDAVALLMLLSHQKVAEPLLLVYHKTHEEPRAPILIRGLYEGPPELPFECSICGEIIESESELLFDMAFRLVEEVLFVE